MTYGVTAEGFNRPSVQDLLNERGGEQRATISPSLDTSPESVQGQMNAVGCRQLAVAWESLETCYNGFDPDRAEDFLLTALCKLTGTTREGATTSKVASTANLDSGTTLEAGVHYAHVAGKPSVRFTPVEDFTAPSDGDHAVTFEAEVTGPVAADAGTLTVIATAVTGWNSITNAADAELGQVADTDPVLRAKRDTQRAATGSQTVAALRSDLFQLGSWIKGVTIFENDTSAVDGEGLPPHSFEVLIFDEGSPVNADDLIAQVIWNNKPGGTQIHGTGESGNATTELGTTIAVPFTRVTQVAIHIEMTLSTDAGFSDIAGVKSYIATQANARYDEAGQDVVALYIEGLPLAIEGVNDVPTFTIDTVDPPVGTSNVAIGSRQIARFDTANIDIT